jgi:hypothetical protein
LVTWEFARAPNVQPGPYHEGGGGVDQAAIAGTACPAPRCIQNTYGVWNNEVQSEAVGIPP